MVAIGVLVPYARAEDGLGKLLSGAPRRLALWVSVLGVVVAGLAIRLNAVVVLPMVGMAALL